jgi:hypothetical protein
LFLQGVFALESCLYFVVGRVVFLVLLQNLWIVA